jgi:hypothetical protein
MVREGRVLTSTSGKPTFGAGYYVQALEVGAQVTAASSGITATVAAGHGLAADDKLIVGIDVTQFREVVSVTATTVVMDEAISLAEGDLLVNLADDSGSIAPNFDGAGLTVYTDMDYQNQAITNTVLSDSNGRYRYYHQGVPRWELVRSASGPFAIYMDDERQDGAVFAHHYATSGDGSEDNPWATAGSNPVQAAVDDLPTRGGVVRIIAGHYDLGSEDVAVNIPILTSGIDYDHQYVFRGDGRDMTFLRYSGTGTAFRYAQVAVGPLPETGSWQSNQLIFEDFSVFQTGTIFTGNAFYMSYINEVTFHRLNVGGHRILGGPVVSEPGYGFEYGIRMQGSVTGQNVVDFNRIDTCLFNGNVIGVYAENQADNLVVEKCWFQPGTSYVGTTYGMEIHNSRGFVVQGNHFNFYGRGAGFSATSFGLKLSGYSSGSVVSGNYFENNPVSIWVYTTGDHKGVVIQGNSISFNATTDSTGILVGILGGSFSATGIVVEGNGFYGVAATNTAIRMNDDVDDFTLISNGYDNTGGTDRVLQVGCRGRVLELLDSANDAPMLWLVDNASGSSGQVRLHNTSTGNYPSPRIKLIPGSGGSGAGAAAHLAVAADSDFQVQNDAGLFRFSVDQSGNTTAVGNVTSGGHLRGLKATEALTTSAAIVTAGRTLIDITNTSGTNTPTLVAPSSVDGQILILRCAALTAGTITLADSGNVVLSAAWVPDAGDTLTLIASGVVWYEIARSAN